MSQDAHSPTSGSPPPPPELLDAYLDGMLDADALAAFERAIAADPVLRAEVDAQRSINASLSRLFQTEPMALRADLNGDATATIAEPAQPAAPPLRLVGAEEAAAPSRPKTSRLAKPISPLYGVAAVLVFSVFAGLYVAGVIDPQKWFNPSAGLIEPHVVYARKVQSNFVPDHVCTTDEEFIKYTKDWVGEPLLIQNTDSIKVVGWSSYEPVFSAGTTILMAKVDGKEVILVMDRKKNDRKIRIPKSTGLHDFSQEFGDVIIHEITPLDSARILPIVQQK
jgi:hypothetical protein